MPKNFTLVTKCSHSISFYLEACENSDYNPLSKSCLWRIQASIKPSKRKHLGGFDNLTASGINGSETLLKLASKYRIEKTTKTNQNGKRYKMGKVKLNLMLLTKLITILPFGCATLVKKSSLSNIVKARRNILVRKVWL